MKAVLWGRAVRMVLGVAVLVAGASMASAQQGRRPGGGGFGGFGGGFGGGKTFLLASEQVRTELKISDDQKTKLDEVSKKSRDEIRALTQLPDGASREDRQKKFEETADQRKKLTDEAEKKIDEILTAEQKTRIDQIVLQQQGNNALTSEKVVEKLGISAEQKTKLEAILKDDGEKRRALFGGFGGGGGTGGGDREAAREKMTKLREETAAKIGETLTAEQKTKWEEMKGKEFKMEFRGFGGAGGGGAGGAGGRPGGAGGAGGAGGRPPRTNENN